MYIPQQMRSQFHRPAPRNGFTALNEADCYELLDAMVTRGTEAVGIIESVTGDLRNHVLSYANPAFRLLTSPIAQGGSGVRPSVITELFLDASILRSAHEII